MIDIPLSLVGSVEAFAVALESHRADLEAHRAGKPGIPAPIAPRLHGLVDQLILRVPDAGPVADRGPDKFLIAPYRVVDDTPVAPETQHALDVLRETIAG
jgi:hypothetical protein